MKVMPSSAAALRNSANSPPQEIGGSGTPPATLEQIPGSEEKLSGMRIIIVLVALELGGSERQALLLARHLKNQQKAHVEVWAMVEPGPLAALCDQYEIPWRIVTCPWIDGRFRRPRALASFARRLRQAHADVILPYTEMPNLICGLVWRWTRARLCVWNQRDNGIDRMITRYEPHALRQVPVFISNSTEGADHLINVRGVAKKRVRVIRNGVELPPAQVTREQGRRQWGIPESSFAACMVANLSDYKDHATLLRAWQLVSKRLEAEGRHPVLLLAGRFDAEAEILKALADDLGLDTSVRFLGPVDDVAGLLNASDVGVLCSNSEGSPNCVLEYMAAGLAVVGTDIPAMREALTPENYSLLAPAGNSDILAGHIVKIANDEQLRQRLGALNRSKVKAEFSPHRMCIETVAVILDGLKMR